MNCFVCKKVLSVQEDNVISINSIMGPQQNIFFCRNCFKDNAPLDLYNAVIGKSHINNGLYPISIVTLEWIEEFRYKLEGIYCGTCGALWVGDHGRNQPWQVDFDQFVHNIKKWGPYPQDAVYCESCQRSDIKQVMVIWK